MKKFANKLLMLLASGAFVVAVSSANVASAFFMHQAKEPVELNKYKKLK